MEVEQYLYDSFKRTEERVAILKRALDAGILTDDYIRIIFEWSKPQQNTSQKAKMMAKVKDLYANYGLNDEAIAKRTGLTKNTVIAYKLEMGLIPVSTINELNAPGIQSGATEVQA